MTKQPTASYILSIFIILTATLTTSISLLNTKLYSQNSDYVMQRIIVQDLVTLVVVVPLLIISTSLAAGQSRRGYLTWLGSLAYFLCTYGYYAFGIAYNKFFLVYVALFSISFFALTKGMLSLDVETTSLRFSRNTPVKTVSGFCIFFGLLISVLWLVKIIPPLVSVEESPFLELLGTTTMVNQVLDLGIVGPLAILTGIWLWKRQSWGYILAAIILFKAITFGIDSLAVYVMDLQLGQTISSEEMVFYGCFSVFAVVLMIQFLRNLREEVIKSYYDHASISYF